MLRDPVDMYAGLSPWLRFGIAGLFLLAALTALLLGRFWPLLWGLGIVFLLFAFPSSAERKGYHDF